MRHLVLLLTIACIAVPPKAFAQAGEGRDTYLPVWSYHDHNASVVGLSAGLGTVLNQSRNTNSYGVRIEIVGVGILSPLLPHSPTVSNENEFDDLRSEPLSEHIYGFNISLTGTFCDCKTVGLTVGGIGQYNFQVSGLSASLVVNLVQVHNGVQVAASNDAYRMRGLQVGGRNHSSYAGGIQIGIANYADNLRGVQIGLWNVNQERSIPILNWAW